MKKSLFIFLLIIIFILLFLILFISFNKFTKNNSQNFIVNTEGSEPSRHSNINSVKYNGWLKTIKSNLVNEKGELIQLRGLSSHGINWYSDLLTHDNLKKLKNEWNINVFRIAMYTDCGYNSYITDQSKNIENVCNVIDQAIDLDMYVIIDWHILSDNNPQIHKDKAKEFFELISNKYKDCPNIIYEICNEPNGADVTWNDSVKPYAEEIIPIIRKNSENSLIIVGTPFWCLSVDEAADNPLNFENIIYSCHFYSGAHGKELQEKIDYCTSKNIPIIVSECGATNASGNGNLYFDKFQEWINYLNEKNISWIYWSFSNKNESSAILTTDYHMDNNTSEALNFNNYLTDSGKFIKSIFDSYSN